MPERIQLHRTRGWRKPEGAIVVARPSKWGNPYKIVVEGRLYVVRTADSIIGSFDYLDGHGTGARHWAVQGYRLHLQRTPELTDALHELRGHDLACWCPLEDAGGRRLPCHADVLLELANR